METFCVFCDVSCGFDEFVTEEMVFICDECKAEFHKTKEEYDALQDAFLTQNGGDLALSP